MHSNPSGRTMALGSTQLLTEMSTRNISWGVTATDAYIWQPYHLHVSIFLKSGSLNLLEPSRPVQACTEIAVRLRVSLRSILMLSFHLILRLYQCLFIAGFLIKTLSVFVSPIHATRPAHQIVLHLIILMIFVEEYRSRSFLLCNSLRSPVTSSLLGPNIFLIIRFSKTLNLCSFLLARDQV
jgi:hypothetical protein